MAFYAGINTVLKDSTEPNAGIEETITATTKRIKMLEATIPVVTIWKQLKETKNMKKLDIEKIIDDQVKIRHGQNENVNDDLLLKNGELNEVDSMRKLQTLMVQEKLIKKRINELERKEHAYKNVLENVITNNVKPCLQTLKNLPPELKNICDCKKCNCAICVQKNDFLAAGQKFEDEKLKRINFLQQQKREKFENDIKHEEEMKLIEFQTRKKLKDKHGDYDCIDSCWRRNIEEIAFKLSTSLNGLMKKYPDIPQPLFDQLKDVSTTVTAAAKIIKLREKHQTDRNLITILHERQKNEAAKDPHLCAIIDYARENKFCDEKPKSPPLPKYCRLCDRKNCLHISQCCKSDANTSIKSVVQCNVSTRTSKCSRTCIPINSKCSRSLPCSLINCHESIAIRDSTKFHITPYCSIDIINSSKDVPINDKDCDLMKTNFSCKKDLLKCKQHLACQLIPRCNLAPPLCYHKPKCYLPLGVCQHTPKCSLPLTLCEHTPICNPESIPYQQPPKFSLSSHTPKYNLPQTLCQQPPKCYLPPKLCQHIPKCNLKVACNPDRCGKHSSCLRGKCGKQPFGCNQKISTCADAKIMKSSCVKTKPLCNIVAKSCLLSQHCCNKEIGITTVENSKKESEKSICQRKTYHPSKNDENFEDHKNDKQDNFITGLIEKL